MTTLGGNLRTVLVNDLAVNGIVGARVFQNHVPSVDERRNWPEAPYIWFSRSGTDDLECLDSPQGASPWREFFDIECCAPEVGVELSLADAVKAALHYLRGGFGDQQVCCVMATDHSDDYLVRNADADAGLNIAALQVRIFTGGG